MTVLSTIMSQDDIHQAGLEVLRRELGVVGMLRFIQQFDNGSGDCTSERAQLEAGLTMDDAIAAIQKVRAEREQATEPLVESSGTITPDASDDELRARGAEALRRELGPRAFVLFLRQFVKPSGDYTAERAQLVGHLTVDEICDAIEKRRREEEKRGHGF